MNVSVIGTKCTGCRACEQSCPRKAIFFEENAEGFSYPVVAENACINCGLCLQRCHINAEAGTLLPKLGFAAYAKDMEILRHSSSGGIFALLASVVLQNGGMVFGCAEIKPGMVRHCSIKDIQDIISLQGSKYVESDMTGVYSEVREVLESGSQVLFSGTPCQIAGLRSFLHKEFDSLFTVDIVCHGVPSRKLYQAYLKWEAQRNNGNIVKYEFRSKTKHGWSLTY